METQVEILFEEGPCFVLNKPAGLLTQSPPGIDSLEWRFKALLEMRRGTAGNVYLGVPHRLDRPVSGPLLFARHVRACRGLNKQFEARTIGKLYWACIEGHVEEPRGTWRDFMRKIPSTARAEVVPADHPDGREAVLHYEQIGESPHGSWLAIQLITGRMHQIRVQAAARGWPIVGDAMYGGRLPFGEQFEDTRLRAIALHGRRLEFRHPMTQEPRTVEAPLPANWEPLGPPPGV